MLTGFFINKLGHLFSMSLKQARNNNIMTLLDKIIKSINYFKEII